MFFGDIEDHGRPELRSRTKRIGESRSLETEFITRPVKPFSLHWMPGQARKSGRRLSRITNPDTTSRSLRWSQEAR